MPVLRPSSTVERRPRRPWCRSGGRRGAGRRSRRDLVVARHVGAVREDRPVHVVGDLGVGGGTPGEEGGERLDAGRIHLRPREREGGRALRCGRALLVHDPGPVGQDVGRDGGQELGGLAVHVERLAHARVRRGRGRRRPLLVRRNVAPVVRGPDHDDGDHRCDEQDREDGDGDLQPPHRAPGTGARLVGSRRSDGPSAMVRLLRRVLRVGHGRILRHATIADVRRMGSPRSDADRALPGGSRSRDRGRFLTA